MTKEINPQRTFIEDFLPVEEISKEAKKEKCGRPSTFEMHYWWARKPLIAARAAILGALLPKDFDRKEFVRLLGLGKDKRAHNYGVDLDIVQMYYRNMWGTKSPKILDPFAGGGSIPLEAMRLGLEVFCADYNPVAYIILKTALEYPQRYKEKFVKDVDFWTDWVIEKTKSELQQLYPEHDGKKVAAYVYAWVVTCPFCGLEIPLVTNWWLVKKREKYVYLNPFVENGSITFTIEKKGTPQKGTVSRGRGRCLHCGHTIVNKYIQEEIRKKRKERLLAVVLLGSEGKEYNLPSEPDINALTKAQTLFNEQAAVLKNDGLLPAGHPDPGEIASARYLPRWEDHFNARQLLLVTTLIKNIRSALQLINKDPEYTAAIAAALYHIIGKHIDYNCRTTHWHTGYEKIGDVMSFRRPSLTWDHSEVNPFVKSSGTLLSAKKCVIDGLIYAVDKLAHVQPPKVVCKSVLSLPYEKTFDIIITDPPYYDNVQYGELSDFFYVWAAKILNKYESEFNYLETPKSEEIDVSTSRYHSKEASISFYETTLQKAFITMEKALKDHGVLVLFFAHKDLHSWVVLANTLQGAGFTITSTWPIHTENANNVIAKGNSIMSSIVITARKRFEEKTGYAEEIKKEVDMYVKKRINECKNSGMKDADVMVAAMGSALEIITQYSDVKSYSGNGTIKDILNEVQDLKEIISID